MQGKRKSTTRSKSKPQSKTTTKGIGDIVDDITTATGIKKVVKNIFGDDCGCEERKQWLNKHTPWVKGRQMTSNQLSVYNKLKKYRKAQTIPASANEAIATLFNEVLNPKPRVEPVTCSSCVGEIYNRLEKLSWVAENTECSQSQNK